MNVPGKPGKPLMEDDSVLRPDFLYRLLCGKLRYATVTCPNIEFSLNQCCRFPQSPGQTHVDALLKIVGYLRKHLNLHLVFIKKEYLIETVLRISGFNDASFAKQPGCRSSYRYVVTINHNAVSLKSRTISTVATSTNHAKYVALAKILKEELHIMYLLEDMGFRVEKLMTLLTYSNSDMSVARYQHVNGRIKHINARYYFACENVIFKRVELIRVPTANNIANMFTKNLPAHTLARLLKKLSVRMQL
jgi:hypothetical protein